MKNPLVKLIADGRIHSIAELKATYHKLVMRTHPDAVGSDKLLRKFLEFSDYYEEAKGFLAQSANEQPSSIGIIAHNPRLEFYKQLHLVESLEMPYSFHPNENRASIGIAKKRAMEELAAWKPDLAKLYAQADAEHLRIKRQKPRGPYMKHALALNIRPILHNIVAFQLTGQLVYAKQSKQNLPAIMQKIGEMNCHSLHDFIAFMIEDLQNGAAVLE
jgi:hypothetical protein